MDCLGNGAVRIPRYVAVVGAPENKCGVWARPRLCDTL